MTAVVLLAFLVSGCGQKGGLYLPTDPAARDRATLPQVLSPVRTTQSAPPAAAAAAASSAEPAARPASAAR
jgi:predicted small lipoprotein YifL